MKLPSFPKLVPAKKTKILLLPVIIGMLVFPQLFLSKQCLAKNQKPVILTDDKDSYEIWPYLEILEDKTGKLTIDDVSSPAFNDRFVRNLKKTPNFAFGTPKIWIRFRVKNDAKEIREWLLEENHPRVYYIDFYELKQDGKNFSVKKTGFLRPGKTRDINYQHFVFKLNLQKTSEQVYYIRYETQAGMIIGLSVKAKGAFEISRLAEFFITGILYGILLIMLCYNLFLLISLKTQDYFYHLLTFFFLVLFELSYSGIGAVYVWPDYPEFNYYSINLFLGFMLISIIKSTEVSSQTKSLMPVIHKLLKIIIAIQIILLLLIPFVDIVYLIHPISILTIFGFLFLFASTIFSCYSGNKDSYYLLSAWIILIIGSIIAVFAFYDIVPSNIVTKNSYRIGIAWMGMFWSLALGNRVNILKNKLEVANRDYQTTIDSMRDMIHVVDRNLNITLSNTAMFEINKNLGLETDFTGKNILNVYPFLDSRTIDEYKKVLKTGETIFTEETSLIKNRKFITETRKTPIIEQGTVTKIVTVIRDVTERKQTEEQLRQAQKMEIVGNLAGGLAHDFNNVLNGIMGSVSLIKYQIQDSGKLEKDSVSECVEIILRSSERAAEMIQRLLTLSRKKALKIIPADLNLTMEQAIKICEKTLDKSVRIIPRYFNETATATVDVTQIEQVLLNICLNAEHAMTFMRAENENWGGSLTIELDRFPAGENFRKTHPGAKKGNYWLFTVSDTGIGMNPEILSKVFNPFFTTKEDGKGSGLGLAMAYNIIKQHNGLIDIDSKENEGTIVNIYLPVPEEAGIAAEDKKDENKNINIHGGGGLILVTDDEEITRKTAKRMLETCGYKVTTAKNGIECIEIYRERYREIKAVLLDMAMPEMSGKDAYLGIKEINPDVKVLFSSGYKLDSRIDEVLKLGVDGFIQKPYTLEKLAAYINKIVNNKTV